MLRKKLLVGNWKMNLGVSKSREFAQTIRPLSTGLKKSEIWVVPSYPSLSVVVEQLRGTDIRVGAQNVSGEVKGAFTGEISVPMLSEIGCSFALTGHSERRHVCGESSEQVARRTLGALGQGLKIILCVGETLSERESRATLKVIEAQLAPVLAGFKSDWLANLVLAYEPVWAIGTGKVASVPEITETSEAILSSWKNSTKSECPPLLYGGSVDPSNLADILRVKAVSGCLIGGASIHPEKFPEIVRISEEI